MSPPPMCGSASRAIRAALGTPRSDLLTLAGGDGWDGRVGGYGVWDHPGRTGISIRLADAGKGRDSASGCRRGPVSGSSRGAPGLRPDSPALGETARRRLRFGVGGAAVDCRAQVGGR
ncbi:hypothetical protein Arub01_51330 [Actinomadura rubrobrunea]|uniref:Uncharacterized protein n=1 Tax=Actinomadura rubrobrunea TaxID=115335 RepID=A0A9W6UX35_9ACTN|nr:hypothetical protein Arub01_51330 [Actinomadura rubrobrunea]